MSDRAELVRECARLAQAIRRTREPGEWCATADGELAPSIAGEARTALDGPALVRVLRWLEAAAATRAAWQDGESRERHPGLAGVVDGLSVPEDLRRRLTHALDDDGRVRDAASPVLERARREHAEGERRLESQLEKWARGFGSEAYVTRHGDRFVALVPAAGFPRRRGIVHDVSGSGQSLFVEPIEVCDANNQLLELRAAALEEERRIVRELAAAVMDSAPALLALEATLVHLDTLRARARWALELGATAITPRGDRLKLEGARHPLLALAALAPEPRPVVPLDLELGRAGRLLLVSGPNMGGKTVVLKTVGLAVALAHAAMPVAAGEGSAVPEIDTVIVDLGDEQSVEQGLSTFAAHLKVLARMAEGSGPRTLLLCDELGAGTDPDEGAALARSLVEHFAARGAWGVVTTHLGSLKRLAGEVPGVVNGSLEFDEETLTSRYRFLPGVPGASHALSVAGRLGFPAPLLERARTLTPEQTHALERLAAELADLHRRLDLEREGLAIARREAETAAADHREAAEASRRDLAERRRQLTRESEALLARVRELWQTVQRDARKQEKSRADASARLGELERLETEVEALGDAAAGSGTSDSGLSPDQLTTGRRVRVVDLGVEAEVVSGPDAEGRVKLKRGSWSIQSHASKLAAAEGGEPIARTQVAATWAPADEATGLDVDLRGLEVEDALATLDRALDRAVVAGLSQLRVVHGVGRGVLRAAVERHLRGHPQIRDQRLGAVGEGGRGVTVARLR